MERVLKLWRAVGKPIAGLLLCVSAALGVAVFSAPREWRMWVPFAFAVIIIVLAARYGLLVSVFGSIAAALVFAYFLYAPLGSFRVANQSERSNLGWMMLGSIALSYLLLPSGARGRKNR